MSNKDKNYSLTTFEQLHTVGAGYDILRYVSLPELLGKESHTILYFMGKELARKTKIQSINDIVTYFKQFGWGTLDLIKEKKKSITFQLLDDAIVHRIKSSLDIEFRYESGFLAEAIQKVYGTECECLEKVHPKVYQVEFTIVFT